MKYLKFLAASVRSPEHQPALSYILVVKGWRSECESLCGRSVAHLTAAATLRAFVHTLALRFHSCPARLPCAPSRATLVSAAHPSRAGSAPSSPRPIPPPRCSTMASEQAATKNEQDQLVASAENMAGWPNAGEANNMSPSVFYNAQPSPQDPTQPSPTVPEQPDKPTVVQAVETNQPPPIALQESLEKHPAPTDPTGPIPETAQPQPEEVTDAPTAETIQVQQPDSMTENVAVSTSIPATVATSATASPVVSTAMGVSVSASTAPKIEPPADIQPLAPLTPAMASMPIQTAPPVINSAPLNTTHVASTPGVAAFTPAGNTHPSIHPQPGQPLDLHENGNLLQQYGAPTAEAVDVTLGTSVGQTGAATVNMVQPMVAEPASQGMAIHVTQNGQPMPQGAPGHVRVVPGTGQAQIQTTAAPVMMEVPKDMRKTQRLPGTKQCPSCQGTIAAAVAKCPKCGHVFRAKKEKPKRSGKRGKKNCPKCGYENPSACSTCRKCGYVFRLKLMDRYKQMRPRPNNTANPAISAAARAHVATMSSQGMRQSAPMPAPAPLATAAVPVGGQDVIHYHTPNATSQAQAMSQGFPVASAVTTIAAAPVQQVHMPTTQVSVVQHHAGMIPQAQTGIQSNIHPHQPHPSI